MEKIEISNAQPALNNYGGRNYQIDFLKMAMSLFVFIDHTKIFFDSTMKENLEARYSSFGWVSVHVFFIISGFLMMKSLSKKNYDPENAGKHSIGFVLNKFRSVALPFWIANAMFMFMYIAYFLHIYISGNEAKIAAFKSVVGEHFKSPVDLMIKVIPEALCITNVGGMNYPWNNNTTWYICAMLFVMIPLAYLAIKKRDFFVNILSLILSILLLGYCREMLNSTSSMVQLIRAVCGLCFGVVAWNICNKINELNNSRKIRICLTIAEFFIYFLFFATLVANGENADWIFPVLLLLPIAIAVTFSQKSYFSVFFNAEWMKYLGIISLYIYLNHYASLQIVRSLFPSKGYAFCVLTSAAVTVILCFANYFTGKIIRRLFRLKQ